MTLDDFIDAVIKEGDNLKRNLTPFAGTAFALPKDAPARQVVTELRVWLDEVEACISKWKKYRWNRAQYWTTHLRLHLRQGQFVYSSCLDTIQELQDELRGIIPQQRILSYRIENEIRSQLTGDELDHASQLLSISGQHEEAILRAAGVIAGVVLERHLCTIIDRENDTLSATERFQHNKKTDGIVSFKNWLVGKQIVPVSESAHIDNLAFIRNCCDHAPGGNLRAPRREEVERLIAETRRYLNEIRFPAEAPPHPSTTEE